MSVGPFGRVLTAMITPFDRGGAVDYDVAQHLARHLIAAGNDGLVISGTTGESPTLTDDEKLNLLAAVREATDAPIIAGTVGSNTRHSIELSQRAADIGVDGILTLCPYYSRPSQAGIEAHFRAVAAAVELPQIIYDIPVRTGRKVSSEVLITLAREVDNIVGVKDAAGSPSASAAIIADTPDDFLYYSGDDAITLPLLAVGAVGVIGVATHWAAPEVADMIDAFERGDVAAARSINAALIESFAFESSELTPNPLPTKAMLRHLGWNVGQCRLPMGDAPAALEAQAAEVWNNLEANRV